MLKEKKVLLPKNIPVHNTYFLDPGKLEKAVKIKKKQKNHVFKYF
jgi:hypothetical protein